MSRPFVSAPRKNFSCQVGPIGTPSSDTTSVFLPSIVILSVRWFLYGSVPATWSAYSGAARHIPTSTTNSARKTSAVLFRLSLRSASRHGPSPATDVPPALAGIAAGTSSAKSA